MAFGWDALIAPVTQIINKLIPDKAAAAAATAQLNMLVAQGQLQEELAQLTAVTTAQSDINKIEAASPKLFVAGWRPMIGWVCAAALCSQYIARPLLLWGFSIAGKPMPVLPGLDDNLWQLMFGMLGMGALRTAEKFKGVASK